jgi:DNA helicase HerA-like ATPase
VSGSRLGTIVDGSLVEGLDARLDDAALIEHVRAGKFVVVEGLAHRYFSLISDVRLESTSQKLLMDPPTGEAAAFIRRVLAGTTAYGTIRLSPMLMLQRSCVPTPGSSLTNGSGGKKVRGGADEGAAFQPVKTIPAHFAPVHEADEADFTAVFGAEDATHFAIGRPLDNDVPLCLDLERFVERSNGVFGKSGTGKSFLTRILLCGLIDSDVCGNLIFDMHNEYGWAAQTEQPGAQQVRGLKQLFRGKVLIYTLDKESTLRRSTVHPDAEVTIDASEITIEDIGLLGRELNLSDAGVETCHLLEKKFGTHWMATLLGWDQAELEARAGDVGAHERALSALWRKLQVLRKKTFITWGQSKETDTSEDGTWESLSQPASKGSGKSIVREIIDQIARGRHIVLEFGRHHDVLSYMLVANILTRTIRTAYIDATERYLASQRPEDRPRQLMITIEEAHSFLSQETARSTTFGQIAREMRKYNVTLLVVDQRPSGIDTEVLSQIGTRITCLLDDDRDVDAVLGGVSGATKLRSILATLEAKQQALLLGYALPMPIVVATRNYDAEFFGRLRASGREKTPQELRDTMRKLFPR